MNKSLKVFFHLLPAIVSLLLVGAHFLRSGSFLLTALSLLMAMVLFIREPFIARAAQVALVLATAKWVHVAFELVAARQDDGQPWTKLAIILGCVALFSLVAAALFFSKSLKEMYHLSFQPANNLQNRMAEHDRVMAGLSSTGTDSSSHNHQRLLSLHSWKTALTSSSMLCLFVMDYSTGLAMVGLVAIGLINSALRKKIVMINADLSPEERKKFFTRQSIGLGLFALPILVYYGVTLPAGKQPFIIGSIIVGFALLLWFMARHEYMPKRDVD